MSALFGALFLSYDGLLALDQTLCTHIEVYLDDGDEELSECFETSTQDMVKYELARICLCRPLGQTRNDGS